MITIQVSRDSSPEAEKVSWGTLTASLIRQGELPPGAAVALGVDDDFGTGSRDGNTPNALPLTAPSVEEC